MPDITDISISVQGNAFLYFVLVLAGILLTFLMYRQPVPPVNSIRKISMGILRGTAVFLLVSMLFSPVIVISTRDELKPIAAFMVDNTKSMTITEKGTNRKDEVLNYFQTSAFESIEDDFEIEAYSFSRSAVIFDPQETNELDFLGEGTDISQALAHAAADNIEKPLKAVVLITDGVYNVGSNPVRAAEMLGVPVYTLITGSTDQKRDILISNIQYNEVSYTETDMQINVLIRNTGYNSKTSTLILKENNEVIESRIIQLPDDQRENSFTLDYRTDISGLHRLTIEVSPLEEEASIENNSREFYIKVLESKIRILVAAGRPSNDFRYLKASLEEHENFKVTGIVRKQAGFYSDDLSGIINGLSEFDLIALVDYPSANSDNFLQVLQTEITNNDIPLLYIRGQNLTNLSISTLNDPLSVIRIITHGEPNEVYMKPTQAGLDHPVFRIHELDSENITVWNGLPPVITGAGIPEISPGSVILGSIDAAKNVIPLFPENTPLVFINNDNGRKILFINAYDIWKWKLIALRDRDIEGVYDRLIENSVKWLTNREESSKVKISSSKEIYRNGEKVVITAQVYDDNYEPVNNAEASAIINKNGININTVLRSQGGGIYEGSSEILEPGEYAFSGRAVLEDRVLGEDNGSFVVDNFSIEMQNTTADSAILKQIADVSGGRFFRINNARELTDIMEVEPVTKEDVFELKIWNRFWLMVLIILLFSIEWFFRKRWGML
ncbi:MAG: VWA domain-containing protein [bacterium]|nr:VWA domain-containing protein [bacterium]